MPAIQNFRDFRQRYHYSGENRIGEGGFGTVYKAADTIRNLFVAVKRVQIKEAHAYTLQKEVDLAAALPIHPNIALYEPQVYKFSNEDGDTFEYAIMQFYESGNLSQYLTQSPLSDTERQALVRGLIAGVQFLHQQKQPLIHRDLKPSNVLIAHSHTGIPVPKITDFGIAKVSADGHSISNSGAFSLLYASPEQTLMQKVDQRTDIWSLGAIIYFICTGRHAFGAGKENTEEAQTIIRRNILENPLPSDIERLPAPYSAIIQRCLVRDVQKRAQSAAELLPFFESPSSKQEDPEKTIIGTKAKAIPTAPKHAPQSQQVAPNGNTPPARPKPFPKLYAGIGASALLIASILFFALRSDSGNHTTPQPSPIDNNNVTPTPEPTPTPKPTTHRETALGLDIDFVFVEGGSFTMGCTSEQGSDCESGEKPTHTVNLSNFYIGKYEVTQAQWKTIMGKNPQNSKTATNAP